ncbi:MAG: fumarylacetoacetate hydrolase family protein [Cellvibrionaceae bacterium]|nr:fumarylacetoacetate hydrolase family protein [Cellvibrionaceae bacterium]
MKTNKIVCVGRNYVQHIKELDNTVPSEPVLFIKPFSTICDMSAPISFNKRLGEVSHELELYLRIGKTLTQAPASEVQGAVSDIGLALDLTLRDTQNTLKSQGQLWEKAKAFDKACPLSESIAYQREKIDLQNLELKLFKNDELQQQGNTSEMMHSCMALLKYISVYFTLYEGDIVLTGTPAGVGPLNTGDRLEAQLNQQNQPLIQVQTSVA